MLAIGIHDREGLVYEGAGGYGRAVWPTPIITPARLVFEAQGPLSAERSSDSITQACRFREDYYDPVSRIRRGRFYFAEGPQPTEWYVQPHPAIPLETPVVGKRDLVKRLNNFQGRSVWNDYFRDGTQRQLLVVLGLDNRFTVWTVINIEAISTGEDLVTLKARGSLGTLPDIYRENIPAEYRARVDESLAAFTDEAHRSAPVSVIDRARDAASQVLIAYYELEGSDAKDLANLAKRLESEGKIVAASTAKILARLHARAKPSERAKREMRQIREQDAELAINCVGSLLCELGWAEWR